MSVFSWKAVLGGWSRLVNVNDMRIYRRIFTSVEQSQNVRFKIIGIFVCNIILKHFVTLM